MTLKQFDEAVANVFGNILGEVGFKNHKSAGAVFYRKSGEDIYHVINCDLLRGGSQFDVKVFATAKSIEPNIEELLPEVGIPSDSFCYLSVDGIGMDQDLFGCKNNEVFARGSRKALNLIQTIAVPYLEKITNLRELVLLIRNPLYLAFAKGVLGESEGMELMQTQLHRLASFNSNDPKVLSAIARLEDLLGK